MHTVRVCVCARVCVVGILCNLLSSLTIARIPYHETASHVAIFRGCRVCAAVQQSHTAFNQSPDEGTVCKFSPS